MQVHDGIHGERTAIAPPAACASCHAMARPHTTLATAKDVAWADLGRRLGLDFGDVASALRALLVRAAERGEEGVPDVLATLDRALERTGRALREAGYGEDTVRQALEGVRERLGSAAAASAELVSAQSITALRKEKMSLAITTQDGDRVQIRFRNREGMVSQTTASGGGAERHVYAFAAGRAEIVVQGELDEAELAAIGELVGKVEQLAADFFAGDGAKAFAAAASLGYDAEQIASFALRLSARESLYQRSFAEAPRPVRDPPRVAAPVPAASSAPAATSEPAPEPVPKPEPAPEVAPPTGDVSRDAAVTGATPPAGLTFALGEYLRGLLDALATPTTVGRYGFSMRWKLEVVVAAVRVQEGAAKPSEATGLLAQSLTALGHRLSEESQAPAAA